MAKIIDIRRYVKDMNAGGSSSLPALVIMLLEPLGCIAFIFVFVTQNLLWFLLPAVPGILFAIWWLVTTIREIKRCSSRSFIWAWIHLLNGEGLPCIMRKLGKPNPVPIPKGVQEEIVGIAATMQKQIEQAEKAIENPVTQPDNANKKDTATTEKKRELSHILADLRQKNKIIQLPKLDTIVVTNQDKEKFKALLKNAYGNMVWDDQGQAHFFISRDPYLDVFTFVNGYIATKAGNQLVAIAPGRLLHVGTQEIGLTRDDDPKKVDVVEALTYVALDQPLVRLLDPAGWVIPTKAETLLSMAAMKYMAQADRMTLRHPQLQQEVGMLRKLLTRNKFEGKDRGKLRELDSIDLEENPEDFQVGEKKLRNWKKWVLRIAIIVGIIAAVVISAIILSAWWTAIHGVPVA